MEIRAEKKVYITPKLIAYGSVEVITQSSGDGDFTHAAFPANTPKSGLTWGMGS